MLQTRKLSVLHYGTLLVAISALLLLWPGLLKNFFATQGYDPHGSCYLWDSQLVTMFVSSDTLIGLAYFTISITLAYFVYRVRNDIPFNWVFLAFGGFIIACGSTHLMDVLTVWLPAYWASGYLRLITAVASVATAIVLPPTLPRIFRIIGAAKLSDERKHALERANLELQNEIGERKRAEAALQKRTEELQEAVERAQAADMTKTRLLSTVTHEMRTPLSSIIGFSNLIVTRKLDSDKAESYALFINSEGRRLANLINDFLDLQRMESGGAVFHFLSVSLPTLVQDALSSQQQLDDAAAHSFRLEADSVPPIYADAERIHQVVLNLLSNAIKYSPSGGEIVLTVRKEGDEVIFSIRDKGLGIPQQELGQLFERFYRGASAEKLRIQGTGLGLALCAEIIRAHNGRIWAASEGANQGATFSFALPALELPM